MSLMGKGMGNGQDALLGSGVIVIWFSAGNGYCAAAPSWKVPIV